MFCTECGKEINQEFKFCPHCGFHLEEVILQKDREPSGKYEEHLIDFEPSNLAKQFGSVQTASNTYRNSKLRLREMGKRLGYTPAREYFFKEPGEIQKWRKISIVWKSQKGFAAAFNVKSKSYGLEIVEDLDQMMGLATFSAERKYVVNVSKKTGQAYFTEVTRESIEACKLRPPIAPPTKAYDVAKIRQYHQNAFKRWSEMEEAELINEFNQGLTLEQMAQKHQRLNGGIFSRLIKMGLISENSILDPKLTKTSSSPKNNHLEYDKYLISPFTFLVKSQKNNKICLACVDNNNSNRWIRPIKAGGFDENDIIMDNGKPLELFDAVELSLQTDMLPAPINLYRENVKYVKDTRIKFVRKLNRIEQELLLSRINNKRLLDEVNSKKELLEKMRAELNQSLVLVGPIGDFGIELRQDENHPRIWIVRDNNYIFNLSCTDIEFCNFIKIKLDFTRNQNARIGSQQFNEFCEKKVYFVIGLTGDSLDENEEVRDGKWHNTYWPLIVSVLTVPSYLE